VAQLRSDIRRQRISPMHGLRNWKWQLDKTNVVAQ
jgi:hypothetical protein